MPSVLGKEGRALMYGNLLRWGELWSQMEWVQIPAPKSCATSLAFCLFTCKMGKVICVICIPTQVVMRIK